MWIGSSPLNSLSIRFLPSVLNLPRSERFKSKWAMILGVIPGPTEPKGNINTFLKPIVDDLISL